MNKKVKVIKTKQCKRIIKNLEKRSMTGYYCETFEEAQEKVLSLINDGDLVSWGGSVTLDESGIKKRLPEVGAKVLDVWGFTDPEEARLAKIDALKADVFLTSSNAITVNGELVNIDGTGNRMAAMAFGPRKVVFVVGINKIVSDVEDGIRRIKSDAAPANCMRLKKKTPCAVTGICGNCLVPGETSCCNTMVTRFCNKPGRMHVILVGEECGF